MQKALQSLEQERPESPLISISGLNETSLDNPAKKFLSQILCVRDGVALPADERENWSPVNFAQLGKRSLRLRFIRCRVRARQNDAPACRHEPSVGVAKGGISF